MPQLFEVLRDMYEHNNTFPDNVTGDTRDVLLMYSIFKEKDMEAVLLSKSYGEYLSRTRDKDPEMKALMSEASISVFKTKLPFNYESNKAMHLMLLPQLEKVYDQYKRNLRQAKGVVPYEKALSFVLDKYIFNLTKPYFQNELNKLAILETNKATASILTYCKREHLERLFILAEEVKRDLIPEDQQIILSYLAHGRYKSKVREYAGDIDYPGLMVACPDSIKSQDFDLWLEAALRTAGIEMLTESKKKEEERHMLTESKKKEEERNMPTFGEEQTKEVIDDSLSADRPVLRITRSTPPEPADAPKRAEEKIAVEDGPSGESPTIRIVRTTPPPESPFDKAMNPPVSEERDAQFIKKYEGASEELKMAAFNYGIKLGFNAHTIAERLQEQGMSAIDAYKKVPSYILEKRGKIDTVGFNEFTKKFG